MRSIQGVSMRTSARVLLAAFALMMAVGSQAQTPVARITDASGAVTFRRGEQWQAVSKTPVDLFDGDKVNTDKGRASVFFVGDESTIVLDVGTNITIHQPASFGSDGFLRRIEIYAGDLWFKMTKGATQHTSLATPTAVGGLRGTEGLVHVESDEESSFTLNEGELEISHVGQGANGPTVRLRGGETLHAAGGQAFVPRPATELPKRPDVHAPAGQLPEPKPRPLKPSEKPSPEAAEAAAHVASETPKGTSGGEKPKPKTPTKPAPKPPKRKP